MDKDLESINQVNELVEKARHAQKILAAYSQQEIDRLTALMAEYGYRASRDLAELACRETGFGRVDSKTEKNIFSTRDVYRHLKEVKTCGIVAADTARQIYQVATPMGLVAAIIPVTNPTSTALFKILIAIKARCGIVLSPHPRAVECIKASADIMAKAADAIGAPAAAIGCLTMPTLAATQALMRHTHIAVILATGGAGLVKAAYSSGKPAIGVGPGNAPAFIEKSADIPHAVRCLVVSQGFDWGTVCASEQAIVVDQAIEEQVLQELVNQDAYLCNQKEISQLEKLMPPGRAPNPDLVGRSPATIANLAGFYVPERTTILVVRQNGVGDRYPLSREKLAPILALYIESGWQAGCERCFEILTYGGMGHTLAIHSRDQQIISAFALQKPAFRIMVNAPTSQGAVGYATRLHPSMTLGCGTPGGNITSDNISSHHLLNIKRIAFGNPGLFKEIETPQIVMNAAGEFSTILDPFTDLPDRNRRYYIGPYNRPTI